MRHFGILAYPASHSLSPQMHRAGFFATATNAVYDRFEISPENLPSFLVEMKEKKHIDGLSVSVPHKETVMEFLDEVDESVEKIGAANTIFWKEGKLCGTNTDWRGFWRSLAEKVETKNKKILVLGAGGATRAVLFALLSAEVGTIFLWNRSQEKAENLKKFFADEKIVVIQNPLEVQNEAEIIINTTSLGMHGENEKFSPVEKTFWKPHHTAFDIVYTPIWTVFLNDAKAAGANAISGEKMLLFQGMEQFEIFTQKSAPEKVMENALHKLPKFSPFVFSETQKKRVLDTIVEEKKFFFKNSPPLEGCPEWGGVVFRRQESINEDFQSELQEYSCSSNHPAFGTPPKEGKDKFFPFKSALLSPKKTPHLIAEIKPASPSKGNLFREGDSVEAFAMGYEACGASCISVLTDEIFFGGNVGNLQKVRSVCSLPILRKDFIFSETQILEAKKYGANAVLLMRSVLSAEEIENFLQLCRNLEMDALVEVHSKEELISVLCETSAEIIGINARNLQTLEIFPNQFEELFAFAHANFANATEKIWIAESGISSAENREKYAKNAHGILVGSAIVAAENRVEKVLELAETKYLK